MVNTKINIAIDGYSSCGKSTLAKALSVKLGYLFIDSGAMYRGITLFALENKLIKNEKVDATQLIALLPKIQLDFKQVESNPRRHLFLNGTDVEAKIRTMEVSQNVSNVARIKEVREFLVKQQREFGKHGGVIMDGRDIGSVVFPNASLKLFVTAKAEVRAQRRFKELKDKGWDVSLQEVKENLLKRDTIDTNRKESPLIQTEDAVVLDNSTMTQEEQLQFALDLVNKRLKAKSIN